MNPQRTQRKRGQKSPLPHSKDVGRNTRWGNPYKVTENLPADEAVRMYRANLMAGCLPPIRNLKPATVEDVRKHLRGYNLACTCDLGAPCHSDVLLQIANEGGA
jgi:hypothetical protein